MIQKRHTQIKTKPGQQNQHASRVVRKHSYNTSRTSRPTNYFEPGMNNGGAPKLKIIGLGGLEEVGRNMTLLEYDKDIIIIDMGLMFPDEDMPGIDYIIPDISYLKGKEKNIKGVIITHGHYDHIGAISHLIPELGFPTLYMTPLTAGLVKKRHEEYKLRELDITIVDPEVDKIHSA